VSNQKLQQTKIPILGRRYRACLTLTPDFAPLNPGYSGGLAS
jgi:hypothetical protein